MQVSLLSYTPDPEKLVATAARLCYSGDTIAQTADHIRDPGKMVRQLKASGHMSPLEHVSFTFGIEGVSRAFLAQISRHRVGISLSVQSQRYCDMSDAEFVLPQSIKNLDVVDVDEDACIPEAVVRDFNRRQLEVYKNLVKAGIPKEDARYVLPEAAMTRMIVTMNARELLHFFELRCCNRAQWEIRDVAWEMLRLVTAVAPTIFEDAGPGCLRGKCTEGKMSCGKADEARQKYEKARREG